MPGWDFASFSPPLSAHQNQGSFMHGALFILLGNLTYDLERPTKIVESELRFREPWRVHRMGVYEETSHQACLHYPFQNWGCYFKQNENWTGCHVAQTKCLPGMLEKDVETVVSLIHALSLLCLFLQIFFNFLFYSTPKILFWRVWKHLKAFKE